MRSDVISGPRPSRPRQEPSRAVESHPPSGAAAAMEPLLFHFFGGPPPVRVQFWDGTALGPAEGDTLQVRSRDAVRRLLWSPGELGLARAFVAGDLDFDGDIFEMLASAACRITGPRPQQLEAAVASHPGRVPAWGRRSTDPASTGGGGTPGPAAFAHPRCTGGATPLRREQRLLRHGSRAFNDVLLRAVSRRMPSRWKRLRSRSTISSVASSACPIGPDSESSMSVADGAALPSTQRATTARRWSASPSARSRRSRRGSGWQHPGSIDRSRSGCRTTATCATGPSTALRRWVCSSMSDPPRAPSTSAAMRRLIRPEGRLLNHAISSVGGSSIGSRSFIGRYVFPDGELIDVGKVVLAMEEAGFEVRDVESLREHYVKTLRAWVGNLAAALGGRGVRGRGAPSPRLAALHGGVGQRVRGRRDLGPPGARRPPHIGRAERHAANTERLDLKWSTDTVARSGGPSERAGLHF